MEERNFVLFLVRSQAAQGLDDTPGLMIVF